MSLIAFAAPIPPGKKEQWDRFMEELTGPRRADFVAASEAAGVRERTYFQETPDGTQMVIVTLEGEHPETAKLRAANEDNDFARWFVQQVQEIHGIDLRQSLPPPVLVVDTGSDGDTRQSATWAQVIKMHVKQGTENEMLHLLQQVRAQDGAGSGFLQSVAGRDQKDPNSVYAIALFESEEKAREREKDPRRQEMIRSVQAKMAEISDGPREFIDLDVLQDVVIASSDQAATAEKSKQLFQRLIDEVISKGNLAVFDELIGPDFVEHELLPPGVPQGREGVKQLFADLHTAFPDIHADIENVVSHGDMVTAQMTWRGTQKGSFAGIPPTGKRASWQVFDMVRVADGKIVEHWGLMDVMGLMQQLGVIPTPEPVTT